MIKMAKNTSLNQQEQNGFCSRLKTTDLQRKQEGVLSKSETSYYDNHIFQSELKCDNFGIVKAIDSKSTFPIIPPQDGTFTFTTELSVQ